MQFIIYFIAGVIQDFLLTLNWRFMAKDKAILASLFSFLTTIISFVVLYNILTKLDQERSIIAIVVYSLGIAAGTFLGMKNKFGMKDK
ncbi:MAG: DUF5698 domain-containing protein [Candidatus Paceibacterota bacterium]